MTKLLWKLSLVIFAICAFAVIASKSQFLSLSKSDISAYIYHTPYGIPVGIFVNKGRNEYVSKKGTKAYRIAWLMQKPIQKFYLN